MKRKLFFGWLILILAVLPLLAACAGEATPTPTATTPAPTATAPAPTATTPAPTATAPAPTATATPTAQANWWDKFGEPEYGGTITYRVPSLALELDPYSYWGGLYDYFGDYLWQWDWTMDRNTWDFSTMFTPDQYWTGRLAESWEMPDAQTIIAHIRQGVQWQDRPPVNGREFTAYDVQEHFDRILGKGNYTQPCTLYFARLGLWKSITATDKYTVKFEFAYPTAQGFLSVSELAGQCYIESPEWVQLGNPNDWKSVVGTGAWILTDFTAGASATYSKNPNYWGYDERHPQNKLPYADTLKEVCIPDIATALAALRTGKVDIITEVGWQQAKSLGRTNPELQQAKMPSPFSPGLQPRVDKEPFTDIRVRKALNMAIDRKTIAQTLYGGTTDGNPCGVVNPAHKGYAYPYADWPQALKDEYSYNPTKAKQLLAEAGYPDGFKTNMVIATTSNDLEVMQTVKAYFKDIGVDMELRTMDMPILMAFTIGKKHDQMCAGSCARTFIPQMNIAAYTPKDMANYGNIQDPAYDAMYQKFLQSTDPEEARQLVNDCVKYALEQHWGINLFPIYSYNVFQPYLKGYSGEFVGRGALGWLWARLWINQNQKQSMGR
jgi:peptide/nickel transport system substrate-binding protein